MAKHQMGEMLRNSHMREEDKALLIPGEGYLLAWGDEVPSDDESGYMTGCLFFHLDGSADDALYVNEGDADDCDFNEVNTA
ncbi:MAG: hypothetical protein ACOCSQ_03425 [Planctomycetota bacterium]